MNPTYSTPELARLPESVRSRIILGPLPAHRPDLGPCWLWTAARMGGGYAEVRIGGRLFRVHRLVYEALVGPIPAGLEPDHLCFVKHCVRPSHLEPVTHAENTRRHFARAESCKSGHPWTEENTYRRPSTGRRECRACNREKHRVVA